MPKKKLPNMSHWTDRQIAEFWAIHSTADYWDDLEEASDLEIEKQSKETVAVRLDKQDIQALKTMADKQGIGHTTLIRIWIKEKLEGAVSKN